MAKKKQDPKTPPKSGEGKKSEQPESLGAFMARNLKDDLSGKNVPPLDGVVEMKGGAGKTDNGKGAGKTAPAKGAENEGKSAVDDKKPPEAETPKVKKQRAARPPDGSKVIPLNGGAAVVDGAGSTPQEKTAAIAKAAIEKANTPPEPPKATPPAPRDAPRSGEEEKIVYIDLSELHPFKNHPFAVKMDGDMRKLVDSIKERGVDQPALVRPREGGGYEMVAGHRRGKASEEAGIKNLPCIVRNMTDEEAVLAMAETNFTTRENILASERAKALKMQLDAIKKQGARFEGVAKGDKGKRSNEIVAERNDMNVKNVQRYIALNNLDPELMKFVDEGKVKFIPAVEMSYISKKNQQYIAMTIDSDGKAPSQEQAKKMRELDKAGKLNGDAIDGIMLEDNKKEERKVIITGEELAKYFGEDKTPAQMKATILKAMDELKQREPLEFGKTEKPKDKTR